MKYGKINRQMPVLMAVLAGLSGAGVGSAGEPDQSDDTQAAECFQTQRVHTITRIDDRHVIAELLGGRRYVLGVEARCRGLENAVAFTVTSRGTRVCPGSFAELIFAERSGRSDQCRIETVERLLDEPPAESPGVSAGDEVSD